VRSELGNAHEDRVKGLRGQSAAALPPSSQLNGVDAVITSAMRSGGKRSWTADLRVDLEDPFFFDHPLDHIPGVLLVCGLLAIARVASGDSPGRPAPARRIALSLTFGSFGETDSPVTLTAWPGVGPASGTWEVRATQEGRAVCEGDITLRDEGGSADLGSPGRIEPGRTEPGRADLVHRHRAENIVIGPARPDDLVVPVLPLPAGHFLSRPGAPAAELLIEAARQFTTMLLIERVGAPRDGQFIWHRLTADLPCVGAAATPTALRAQIRAGRGQRRDFQFEVIGTGSAADVCPAHIGIEASSMSMGAFRRFRAARRTG
jgi:hypothetical protein